MKANHHIKAMRRLLRSTTAFYARTTTSDADAVEAVEHYRRLLREDAARIRRAERRAAIRQSEPTVEHHNPAA